MSEPEITINGMRLSEGQAMTVRVALEAFAMSLSHDGLGDDAHGVAMTEAYLSRVSEIRSVLYLKPPGVETK